MCLCLSGPGFPVVVQRPWGACMLLPWSLCLLKGSLSSGHGLWSPGLSAAGLSSLSQCCSMLLESGEFPVQGVFGPQGHLPLCFAMSWTWCCNDHTSN